MIITQSVSAKEIIDLVQLLHSSLDLSEIIDNFYLALKKTIDISGIHYHFHLTHSDCYAGETLKHNYHYHLTIDKLELGEIEIYSSVPLQANDVLMLEEYLCLLVGPLKNAVMHQQALKAALHDPLTGLLNRTSLDESLGREINLSHRYSRPLSILSIDLDNFKTINDTFGHAAGDAVIIHFANHLKRIIRNTDIAFRLGGEEFLVLLNNTTVDGAIALAERIRVKIENSYVMTNDNSITYTICIGISQLDGVLDQQVLIENADQALYEAKADGKNQVRIFSQP